MLLRRNPFLVALVDLAYAAMLALAYPFAWLYAKTMPVPDLSRSVLHVSYMVHVPWHMTRILRKYGWHADYLAVGTSAHWDRCDFQKRRVNPLFLPWYELWLFWRVVSRYEVVHFHFMITMTRSGWEVPLLKRMGRRVVAHYRGCEARDRDRNMQLHPGMNICQNCDYNAEICTSSFNRRRRAIAAIHADVEMVTTPDMLDFVPNATVSSFFIPDGIDVQPRAPWDGHRSLRLVHVTNHPGIEGTEDIRGAVESVRAKGFEIDFVHLNDVGHAEVLAALRDADLAIGKMKMGYYANSQIESMMCGVPTITWIRPEFMSDELRDSGFIVCHPTELEATLLACLSDPQALAAKQRLARSSIYRLHDEKNIAGVLIKAYTDCDAGTAPDRAPLLRSDLTVSD
jgi:glycosyltransferase involved in cell wall biosynthesis